MLTRTHPNSGRIDPTGATRLTAVLMQAFEIGVIVDPLHPGGTVLHHLGPALSNLHQELQHEIDVLAGSLDAAEPERVALRASLIRLADQTMQLMNAARSETP